MHRVSSLFLLLVLAAFAHAQPMPPAPKPPTPMPVPAKPAPAKVMPLQPKGGDIITITTDAEKPLFDFDGVFTTDQAKQIGQGLAIAAPTLKEDKTYLVRCIYSFNGQIVIEKISVKVTGTDGPTPVDPAITPLDKLAAKVDALTKLLTAMSLKNDAAQTKTDARLAALEGPRPPPTPDPPKPDPPSPAPIPLPGFRVLIIYDPATLTPGQQGIVYGKAVRDYLQAKCVVGADGKTKDFWILQKGLDVSAAPKWIGDVIQRHPGQSTFLVVSDGKTGYDGPIPENAVDALAVLQKVGGP